MNRMFKRTAFIKNRVICNIINVFTVTFDQFNMSLMDKSIFCFISMTTSAKIPKIVVFSKSSTITSSILNVCVYLVLHHL